MTLRLHPNPLFQFGLVATTTILALLFRLLLHPLLNNTSPFLAFTIAVMVCAAYGGLVAGVAATILSTILGILVILPPYGSITLQSVSDAASVGLFVLVGVVISWLNHQLSNVRQQAQARLSALEQSELRYRQLFGSPLIGVYEARLGGQVLDANDAFLDLVGYTRDDVRAGRVNWKSMTPTVYQNLDQAALVELGSAGFSHPYEKEYIRKSNECVSVLIGWVRMPDDDNRVLCFTLDMTAQKQAELERRNNEQLFQAIFEQAAVGIGRVDPEGNWLQANDRLCRIVGYDCTELLHLSFQDITHPDDLEADLNFVQQLLAGTKNTYSLEKRYVRKDGSPVWINLAVSLVRTPEGLPKYFISVVQDINERKQAEAEIRRLNATLEQRVEERTAQLEAVNTELEAFAYTVSHDLRAPLRSMHGLAEVLLDDYGDRLDDNGRVYARQIIVAARQMDQLIADLLTFSRLSRAELRLQPVRLSDVLADAQTQLADEIRRRQAHIRIPPDLPPVVAHVPTLVQVATNLLSNAIKFVAPDVTPHVHVWAEQRGKRVRLWIADNGIGIASAHQERIFQVFERLHGQETYPGTGIGLAIVRKGVERMGGQVGVESAPGQGSRFWIELAAEGSAV